MKHVHYVVPYRRKRERKTNYHRRLRLLQAGKPRLVVRLSNTRIIAQLISWNPDGDQVLVGMDSSLLSKASQRKSLKCKESAYLLGKLVAQRAKEQGITEAIFDAGFRLPRPGNRLSFFLRGALEGGLSIPHNDSLIEADFPEKK